jgi:hypothetical protein
MLDFHMLTTLGRFEAGEIDAAAVLSRWAELSHRAERMGDTFGQMHPNYFTWCSIMDEFKQADADGQRAVAKEWLDRTNWREPETAEVG